MSKHLQTHTPMDENNESYCSQCVFDRLPPEMIRFIFRKLSTEDLLQVSATTDLLYRVAQHHLYLTEGALLVRGGHDTASTVAGTFNLRNVSSLYLADVYDFDRDVPDELLRPDDVARVDVDDESSQTSSDQWMPPSLDVLHVRYAQDVRYADLPIEGLRRVLTGARANRVCFSNVLMTADDVADVVAQLQRDNAVAADAADDDVLPPPPPPPPVLRCTFDRADDGQVLRLLDLVECTCAGLLAEFRVTVRRPAPRAYAVYPAAGAEDGDDGGYGGDDGEAGDSDGDGSNVSGPDLPEGLLAFTAADCAGLPASEYGRLAAACPRLRRLRLNGARRADDDSFRAVVTMPSLVHLDVDGLCNVTSDGLMSGLEGASRLQSLGLRESPYVTDDVLQRVGELRRLRRLSLDLTVCDKTTAAGVRDMLSGCDRLRELHLTVPLNKDYVDAVAAAAALPRLRTFRLTFERLSFQDHLDNQPADGWRRALITRFRDVHMTVDETFTRIAISVD